MADQDLDLDAMRTKAGRLLWHELPEEYRYRDASGDKELGDLEAYLHGHGHLLDLIRTTTEQAYADAFAEDVDGKSIQPWLLPYLAEMLGAQLVAPDPVQRTAELNNSVGWYKAKGTLAAVDSVADVVAGTETVSREGWRHTLTTPRMSMPPFTSPPNGAATDALTASMQPRGCPDLRLSSRAVQDPDGINPLFLFKSTADGSVYWRHHNPTGVPCFPGAYDDATQRTPDLRDPDGSANIGPHPRRTLIHVRPPQGFFADGLIEKRISSPAAFINTLLATDETSRVVDAATLCAHFEIAPIVDRIQLNLTKDLNINSGHVTLDGVNIARHNPENPIKIRVSKNSTLTLRNCAVEEISVVGPNRPSDTPQLILENCIVDRILADNAFVRMEYVTVMDNVQVERLQASDCIIADLGDTMICDNETNAGSCLRYSALDFEHIGAASRRDDCITPTNTSRGPNFLRMWFHDPIAVETDDTPIDLHDTVCVQRRPRFGEAGYGVLDLTTAPAILQGAEDQGEMGGYHNRHHAAAIDALRRKLTAFLPVGQEIAISYDPLLAHTPPTL
jgi:hypothetical protein